MKDDKLLNSGKEEKVKARKDKARPARIFLADPPQNLQLSYVEIVSFGAQVFEQYVSCVVQGLKKRTWVPRCPPKR